MPEEPPRTIAVRSLDGTLIAGRSFGEGSAALVIVPGALSGLASWEHTARLLSMGRTVIVLDRRGHGRSPDPPGYAPVREVEDVLAFLGDRVGPVDLLGHSSGAIIALHVAMRTPPNLRCLVIYEPPVFFAEGDRVPGDLPERLDASLAAGDPEGAVAMFMREGPRASEEEIDELKRGPVWPYVLEMASTIPHDARIQRDLGDALEPLGDARVPTLVLIGGASPPRMRDGSLAIAAALPDRRIVTLAGQGHRAMLEAPEPFSAVVDAFLTAPDP